HDLPVAVGLRLAACVDGARISIVDERHAVADEDVVLELDALADERVTGDLHPPANLGAVLDLNKGANPPLVADLRSVQVDEVEDCDVFAKLHVRRDGLELHAMPWSFIRESSGRVRGATGRLPRGARRPGCLQPRRLRARAAARWSRRTPARRARAPRVDRAQ